MYKADYHMHTSFSVDSQTPMENQIQRAISLGFNEIAITDHNEDGLFDEEYILPLDINKYINTFNEMKEKYKNQISLKLGIEIGYDCRGTDILDKFVSSYPFDFVICSLHSLDKEDFYFGNFFDGKTKEQAYTTYFQGIEQCIDKFKNFNVFGHLDFISRYWPYNDKELRYEDYKDIIDTILKKLISNSKGIELNTSGIRYNLGHMHPQTDIIKRYKELGGEIITIGSDSHQVKDVGADYENAREILKQAGFKYFTTFTNRNPEFKQL